MGTLEFGNVELRPYQDESVSKFLNETGCLVAYDKAGGKTITALALTERRLDQLGSPGPILIISDESSPWCDNFALAGLPGERIHLLEDSPTWFKWLLEEPSPGEYYVIHWAAIIPWFKVIGAINWHTVIADEVHAAKNEKAQRTIGLKHLRTTFKVGLTADPDDNVPPSMWSLLNWLYPKRYTSKWRWIHQHFRVYEQENYKTGKSYKVIGEPLDGKKIREEIDPFFVKMTMKEMDPDQPDDLFEEILVDMTPEQRESYEQMVDWQMMQIGDDIVISDYSVVKFTRLQQLAQAMGRAETHKVWRWFTEYDDNGNEVKERRQVETVKIRQTEPSPKLDAMIKRLVVGDLGPTIIFSQFPDIVEMACKRLSDAGYRYVAVRDNKQTTDCVRAFQRGDVDIIIGTTGLLSESVRLFRADTVIHLDTHYNPRVVGQANGRAKNVGKRTPVRIIYIRTRNSVDMIRLDKARTKQEWRTLFLGERGEI